MSFFKKSIPPQPKAPGPKKSIVPGKGGGTPKGGGKKQLPPRQEGCAVPRARAAGPHRLRPGQRRADADLRRGFVPTARDSAGGLAVQLRGEVVKRRGLDLYAFAATAIVWGGLLLIHLMTPLVAW